MTLLMDSRLDQGQREKYVVIGMATNTSFVMRWQSPEIPAPTILANPSENGGSGWILIKREHVGILAADSGFILGKDV